MSIESLIYNKTILNELANVLAPLFPGSGITTLTNTDGNIQTNVISNSNSATVNFSNDINVAGQLTINSITNLKKDLEMNGDSGTSGQLLTSVGSGSVPSWSSSVSINDLTVNTITNLKQDLQMNGDSGTSGQVLTSSGAGSVPTWTTSSSTLTGLTKNIFQIMTQQPTLSSQVILVIFNQPVNGFTIGKNIIVEIGFTMYLASASSLLPVQYSLYMDGVLVSQITSVPSNVGEHIYRQFLYNLNNTVTSHTFELRSQCIGGVTLNIVDQNDYYTINILEIQ